MRSQTRTAGIVYPVRPRSVLKNKAQQETEAGVSFDTRVGQPPHNMTTHNHDLQPTLTTLSIRLTYRAPNVSPT
jgi:hypothetical protein